SPFPPPPTAPLLPYTTLFRSGYGGPRRRRAVDVERDTEPGEDHRRRVGALRRPRHRQGPHRRRRPRQRTERLGSELPLPDEEPAAAGGTALLARGHRPDPRAQ